MAVTRVAVRRPVLEWAQRRGRHDNEAMRKRFPAWDRWVAEDTHPTVKQAQDLAAYTHVPFGMLLLETPPTIELPIPDFRVTGLGTPEPSQELLDTIHLNQQRQAWFEDYLATWGEEDLPFVGSARGMEPTEAAAVIRNALGYELPERSKLRSNDDARKYLVRAFEELGGLTVLSSMVGNNTHRLLDRDEFRGFTLRSATAPLVFVNAHDTKAGQVFSLLHEFAHVWHGDSGVSVGGAPLEEATTNIERWCDAVAAEIAVPKDDLITRFDPTRALTGEVERLASYYRCSTLVILIRLRDLRLFPGDDFATAYRDEVDRLLTLLADTERTPGGDFYNNQPFRIGERLSRALIADTRRGTTPVTDAVRLMAFSSPRLFDEYANRLEGR